MNKELFISSTPHETRLAIMEDGDVVEVYYEREKEYSLAGSIYKGRVTRVLPGMQSAFVDIGLERDAFLYVSDFFEDSEEYDRVVSEAEDAVARLEQPRTRPAFPSPMARPAAAEGALRPERSAEPAAAAEGSDEDSRRHRRGRRRGRRGRGGIPDSKFASPGQEHEAGGEAQQDEFAEQGGEGEEEFAEPLAASLPGDLDFAPGALEPEPSFEAPETHAAFHQLFSRPEAQEEREERREESRPERELTQAESPRQERETPAAPIEPSVAPAASAALVLPGESLAKYRHLNAPEAAASAGIPVVPAVAPPTVEATALPAEVSEEPTREAFEHERMRPDSPRERGGRRRGGRRGGHRGAKESVESVPERDLAAAAAETAEAPASVEEAEAELLPISEQEEAVLPEAETFAEREGAEDEVSELEAAEALDLPLEPASDEGLAETEFLEGELSAAESEEWGPTEGGEPADADSASLRQAPNTSRFEARGRRRRRRRRGPGGGGEFEAAAAPAPAVAPLAASEPAVAEARPNGAAHAEPQGHRAPRLINELLREGQEILIQIAKEPLGKKGARITSHLALPGRYLVYMPTTHHIGVSRKIGSDEERARLKRFILDNTRDLPGGFIVRTAGAGASEEEFLADIRFLSNLWSEMRQQFERVKAPALLHHDLNLVERTLRDQLSSEFSHIWVDTEEQYQRVVRFVNYFMPHLTSRIKLYTREAPMYEHFGIQEEINKALKSKVWLKSGGYIVINQTEALVAIDVNTGKYVGKSNRLEDTIVKTNLDAIREIVRQIRLRDLGGIIVIDFIDMDERKNRQKVLQSLEEAMRVDKAPSKVLSFNDFGLVALTRKRVKQSLERTLGSACPYCSGVGLVKSIVTVCNEIFVEVRKMAPGMERDDLVLRVNPEVAKALKARQAQRLLDLEELTGKAIAVKPDASVHQEQFEIY